MSKKQYQLFEWIKREESIREYIEWRRNPVTEMLLYGAKEMSSTNLIPPSPQDGKIDPLEALQVNAFRAGRDSVLNMLLNLDDYVSNTAEEDVDVNENMIEYLMENDRYSRAEAIRILKNEEIGI
jgi:hypothetical protein